MSNPPGFKTRTLDSIRRVFTTEPLESVLFFFLRGVEYSGFWPRLIPGPHLYPHGSMRSVARDGIRYELDISCLMQWYIFWGFKEKQRDRLYSLVNDGDVVLDVGTNVGETLFHFAQLAGERGVVYGFEPDESNFANVRNNISLNEFKNVEVFNAGVSDKRETVKLYRVDPHNLGMNRILNEAEAAEFADFTTIETDTLDRIVSENKIERVDLIKIDIEGYEMHALRGARGVIEKFKPRLFIEVGYTRLLNLGTSPAELIGFLEEFDYRVFHAETEEKITAQYDFAALGDGAIDIYALPENDTKSLR